ncbi:MAG: Phenylalanyl-tRNA synthetase alpha subunit [Candidatus Alkanophagales archaeon MCA70_species_1]|nr:Phenylalanyl-tRNA synthetase alpha subunit [Candidatus Alkanophaga volatiphilum]
MERRLLSVGGSELASELSANERKVLTALGKLGGNGYLGDVAESGGLSEDAATQAAFLLAQKKLIGVKEEKETFYKLTDEGRQYVNEGLPERLLLRLLLDQRGINLEGVSAALGKRAKIAIGWLVRKGWGVVSDVGGGGKMLIPVVKSEPPEGDDERVLRALGEFGAARDEELARRLDISSDELDDIVKVLKRRNLIEVSEVKRRRLFLTEEGRRLLESGVVVEEEITRLTPSLLMTGAWRGKKFRSYDVSVPAARIYVAKIHPYQRILERIRRIFVEMGFVEIKGAVVQPAFWNFDVLFVPQDHPAREMQDTFYLPFEEAAPASPELIRKVKEVHESGGGISTGWGGVWSEELARRCVLRTHTTAVTIRYLAEHPEPPVKVFCIDRVYRRETPDATHIPEFDQLEGIVLDEGVSFKNLLGCLSTFYRKMGFGDVRFRPGYFPYTEPSVESEVYVEGLGWVELGGAGIFREEVTKPLGIKHPVLAWGLGVGRLAMLILGLKDIRKLYQPDIQWLREFPASKC